MIYKIEIENKGGAAAEDVVVTNLLPSGVTVDTSHARTSAGAVAVQGNSVTAQLGDMAPDAKVVVEIPVSVGTEAGTNISTQASAQYAGASNPVQSNAYIAQVAEPQTGVSTQPQTDPPAKPQEQQPQTKPQEVPPQAKPQEQQPQTKPVESKPAPPQSKPANTQTKQNAPMPQTGGSFPLFLAVALVTITLLARYLRGRNYRRV
jgi:outer membrane biosynthesis protein TonB